MREHFFLSSPGAGRVGAGRVGAGRARAVFLIITILAYFGVATGCSFVVADSREVTLLVWNVENLFDAVDQGSEYPEFTSEGGWTERDYQRRKQRIAQAVHALRPRPDILVFVEIENRQVLDALMDKYVVDINAPYRAFTRGPGAAIGIGIASRYPISAVHSHLARSGEFPPLRPVLETQIDLAGTRLVIFSNHWKSKSGGAPATEPLRRASARLLAARLEDLYQGERDLLMLVVGDFNERPREFDLTGGSYPTALMPVDAVRRIADTLASAQNGAGPEESEGTKISNSGSASAALPSWATQEWLTNPDFLLLAPDAETAREDEGWFSGPVLVNLWDSSDAPGSYYFINSWEQIDGIFATPALLEEGSPSIVHFSVPCVPDGCDSQGRPVSWKDDAQGVSDHLPLLLSLDLGE